MPTINSSEAGRALGAICTPEKAAASRKNLSKARAKIAAALAAYKNAPENEATPEELERVRQQLFSKLKDRTINPTLLVPTKGEK